MDSKFKEKNEKSLKYLDDYIQNDRKKISFILVSCEVERALNESGEDDLPKYKGIRLVMDAYVPSSYLKIITKYDVIHFNTPCLCGIYNDEVHP